MTAPLTPGGAAVPARTGGAAKCRKCGYSLDGLGQTGSCPECATKFDKRFVPATPNALPDPQWTEGPTECVNCGYSLEGLAIPGKCPECGAPFDAQVMVLHGVARTSAGGPLWRKVVWIVLIVVGILLSQGWVFILMYSWVALLVIIATLVGAVLAMFATGKRERAGTERFMFTSSGLARLPVKRSESGEKLDSVFIPYTTAARLRIDTVSPFWRRVRLYMPNQHGVPHLVFDAGFRCPTADLSRVEATILAAIRGDPVPGPADPGAPPPPPPLPREARSHPPTIPGPLPPPDF